MRALAFFGMGLLAACGGELDVGDEATSGGSLGSAATTSTGSSNAMGGMVASGGRTAGGGSTMGARPGTGASGGVGANGGDPGMGASSGDAGASAGGYTGVGGGESGMGAYSGMYPAGGVPPEGGGSGAGTPGAGGSAVGGTPMIELPHWPDTDDVTAQPEITGVWEGYTEDFLFRPLDKYRLEISGVNDEGVVRGVLRFGTADPLPPAEDPEGVYPPGSDPTPMGVILKDQLVDGGSYTILDGAERPPQLRFQISPAEIMRGWCGLQEPQMQIEGGFGCLPYSNGYASDGKVCYLPDASGEFTRETTLAFCTQCLTCVCDAERCDAMQVSQAVFDLTLNEAGDELVGTGNGSPIRLKKVM